MIHDNFRNGIVQNGSREVRRAAQALASVVPSRLAPLARVALVEFEPKFTAAGAVQAEIEGIVGTRHSVFSDLESDPYPNQLPTHEISSWCFKRGARCT